MGEAGPTILVADDDRITREFLAGLLKGHGFSVEMAVDGREVIERVGKGKIDLVLLDVIMPNLGGLEACRILKSMQGDGFLPVLILTVKSDIESRVEGLRIGADDYVCKPFEEKELLARVNSMLRIKQLNDQVQEAKRQLADLAVHDELTGLYNYRYLNTRLNEEFKRAERYHDPLSCIMVDLDKFKDVNDSLGHAFGDGVLRQTADVVRAAVREMDVVARYGGDEFLLILPSTHLSGCLSVADRLWRQLGSHEFVVGKDKAHLTASMGVAFYPSRDIKTKDELLKFADEALYQAKREGRNRICLYQHQGYLYRPEGPGGAGGPEGGGTAGAAGASGGGSPAGGAGRAP